MRIGVITFPISKAGNIPVSNLVDVLDPSLNDIYLITGNAGYNFFKGKENIHTYGIRHNVSVNAFSRVIGYILTQLKISYVLIKISRYIDVWIFFMGGEGLLLPMLIVRLLRAKVVLALAGYPSRGYQVQKDILFKPTSLLSKINFTLSNRIVAYSERIVEERGLKKYKNKISITHKHFLDFDKFRVKKQIIEREKIVGYIGTLSKIKGVLNLVRAFPNVLKEDNEIEFVIGGGGDRYSEIKEFIDRNNLSDKVKLIGWIPHDELPEVLNELKIVVLPSYTEGLPNIVLEAMACGTPVITTSVGAIPDVIKDEETGFILENISPECIAKKVIMVLNYPDLDRIVKNARKLVEKEFTYEAAVEGYKVVLSEIKK